MSDESVIVVETIINRQAKLGLTDAALVEGIITYHRWWRIKKSKKDIKFDEAFKLLTRVGYELRLVIPEQLIVLNNLNKDAINT